MRQSTAILSFFASAAFAETQIPFFWPGFESSNDGGVNPVASVVSANPSTTVMELACPTDSDSTECGWGNGDITYTVMSKSTYVAQMSAQDMAVSFGCTSKDAMVCVMALPTDIVEPASSETDSIATGTTTFSGDEIAMQTATVTAGEDKLQATGGASAAPSGSGSSFATSASAATGAQASKSGASATGSGSPAESTGAAGRFGVDGAALLALAGAAAMQVL